MDGQTDESNVSVSLMTTSVSVPATEGVTAMERLSDDKVSVSASCRGRASHGHCQITVVSVSVPDGVTAKDRSMPEVAAVNRRNGQG